MARPREELQILLEEILGSKEVYYQPPPTIQMHYPAIVYNRSDIYSSKADNGKYLRHNVYNVTLMDRDPDSVIVDRLFALEHCRFSRHYVVDNLNHDIFTLYF